MKRDRCGLKATFVCLTVILSSAVFAFPAHAKTYKCTKGGSFEIYNGTIVDEGETCKGTAKIPASVASIRSGAFAFNDKLTAVVFNKDSKLAKIGDYAFEDTALTAVNIPASVTFIGYAAFSGTAITSLTIPTSLTAFGTGSWDDFGALGGMEKLRQVKFATSTKLKSFPDSLFSNDFALTAVNIPASVTSIGDHAFAGTALSTVNIPASVTSIGGSAFSQNRKLYSITFERSSKLKHIGWHCFEGDSSLKSLTIPDSVSSIDNEAFSDSYLTNINVSEANATYSSTEGVLFNKSMRKLISYPERKSSTAYIIPNTVTAVGDFSFSDSANLREVTIPDSVITIGQHAFDGAKRLQSVTFTGTSRLQSIKRAAFQSAQALDSVTIPASVITIGDFAFSGTGVGSVEISPGSNLTNIGEYAFQGASIVNLILPCSLKSIGKNAFGGNNWHLQTIHISCDLVYLGDEAFWAATGLESVYFLGSTIETVGINVFDGTPSNTKIYIKPETQVNFAPFGDSWEGLIVAEYTGT